MPYDKLIDSAVLDAGMSATADAIRAKTNAVEKILWKNEAGFSEAIAAIEASGGNVQKASGSISAGGSAVTVNCGFQPDIVMVKGFDYNDGNGGRYQLQMCFDFADKDNNYDCMVLACDNSWYMIEAVMTQTNTGFQLSAFVGYDENWDSNSVSTKKYNYVAYKLSGGESGGGAGITDVYIEEVTENG